MNRSLILILCFPLLQACGTSKAYRGPDLPADQMTTIHALRFSGGGLLPRTRAIQILQVDELTVGSYYRGYPATVRVKPGERAIKISYFDSNVHGGGSGEVAAGILGGAIGGAIYGAMREPKVEHEIRTIRFDARPGVNYVIDFDTATENPREVPIWIAVEETGGVVARSEISSGTASGAPSAPVEETEIARAAWKTISTETPLKVYAKSGATYSGRLNSFNGEYLWLSLSNGGTKALLASEIDKLASLK